MSCVNYTFVKFNDTVEVQSNTEVFASI